MIYRTIIKIILLIICLQAVACSSELDPHKNWQVSQTEHFRIIYLAEYHHIVSANINFFEEESEKINALLKSSYPNRKIDLILNPQMDMANGYASSYIGYTIQINLVYPEFMALSFNDWVRFVFIHEYVHIEQFSGPLSLPSDLLKKTLGISPEYLQQSYALEGLAVFYETMLDAGGRGRSGDYQKYIRVDAMNNNLPDESQLANPFVHRMPGLEAKYIYSSAFFEYLKARYGESRLADLLRTLINKYAFRDAFSDVYNKNLFEEVTAWQHSEQMKAVAFSQTTGAKTSLRISDDGGNKKNLRQLNKDELIYLDTTSFARPDITLLSYNLKTHKKKVILNDFGFEFNLSVDKEKLIYAKYNWTDNYNYTSSLYLLNLTTNRVEKLPTPEHVFNPCFGPDENTIIYTRYENMIGNLYEYDLRNHKEFKLTGNDKYTVTYTTPVLMNSGTICAIKYETETGTAIMTIDPKTKTEKILLKGNEYKITLAGLAEITTENELYFEGDHDGQENIYSLDLSNNQLSQLTNTIGGAQFPVVTDNTLYFLDYDPTGINICTGTLQSIKTIPVTGRSTTKKLISSNDNKNSDGLKKITAGDDTHTDAVGLPKTTRYNPVNMINTDLIGATLYLKDTLDTNEAYAGINPTYWSSPEYIAGFANNQLGPTIGIDKSKSLEKDHTSAYLGGVIKSAPIYGYNLGYKISLTNTLFPKHDHADALNQQISTYLSSLEYSSFNFSPYSGNTLVYSNFYERYQSNKVNRVTAESYIPFQIPLIELLKDELRLHLKLDGFDSHKKTWFADYTVRGYRNVINNDLTSVKNLIQGTIELNGIMFKCSHDLLIGNLAGVSYKAFGQVNRLQNQQLSCIGYGLGLHMYFFNYFPITFGYLIEVPLNPYNGTRPKEGTAIEITSTF